MGSKTKKKDLTNANVSELFDHLCKDLKKQNIIVTLKEKQKVLLVSKYGHVNLDYKFISLPPNHKASFTLYVLANADQFQFQIVDSSPLATNDMRMTRSYVSVWFLWEENQGFIYHPIQHQEGSTTIHGDNLEKRGYTMYTHNPIT